MLDGYEKSEFAAPIASGDMVHHDVYTRGSGPVVVIVQELPGIGPETLSLADRFIESGFRVALPHLFGPLGKVSLVGNMLRVFCIRREFHLFQNNATSPIVDWLKALCRKLRTDYTVSGVGVIGMCLTGNFAISLMADDSVLASVASQPSLPLMNKHALHMSEAEVDQVRTRLDEHGPMLAYRFEGDVLCKADKFDAIDSAFNDDIERVRLTTLPGKGHSVFTLDFADAGEPTRVALEEVLAYFRDKLA
ncbi:MAG: dienelactone hydrolase [bacterium]|nr:dienelactone hydrolase [bacterium]